MDKLFDTPKLGAGTAGPLAWLARRMRLWRNARRGGAAIEFALVSPFLLGLLVPLADLGAYVYYNMELQLAAQAGAEYAARHGWDPTGIQNAIITAAPNLNLHLVDNNFTAPHNSDVTPSPFTPANVQFCACANGTALSQVTTPCPNPRPTCTGTGVQAGVYYTVGAQTIFHTISGFQYPFVPDGQVIQASATVRVQ